MVSNLCDQHTIIISNQLALGDNLLHSTLPERFKRLGKKVFISLRTMPRNTETVDMWNRNPYIDGWSDEEPNAGLVRLGQFWHMISFNPIDPLGYLEAAHDLLPPYSRYPIIYGERKRIPELENVVLVDPCSSSSPFSGQQVAEFLQTQILPRYRGKNLKVKQVRFLKVGVALHGLDTIEGLDRVDVPDLQTYCDMIYSCRAWVGVESGGQVMASAIRGDRPYPEVHALFTNRGFNTRMFIFPNVEYTPVRSICFGDYQEPRPQMDEWMKQQGMPPRFEALPSPFKENPSAYKENQRIIRHT